MTLIGRLAVVFRAHPRRWFDGRELATIGGCYAWRSRVSDLRRPPYSMVIRNRQRSVRGVDGRAFVISEYCYQPDAAADATPAAPWELRP